MMSWACLSADLFVDRLIRPLGAGLLALAFVLPVNAALTEGTTSPKPKKSSQELSFEDILVQGKYHFSDESVTTVEEDKVLDALLGVRKDFKDRMQKSTQE